MEILLFYSCKVLYSRTVIIRVVIIEFYKSAEPITVAYESNFSSVPPFQFYCIPEQPVLVCSFLLSLQPIVLSLRLYILLERLVSGTTSTFRLYCP